MRIRQKSQPNLKLDWCSYEAAKYAVKHWHYSKRMPDPKSVKIGIWENDIFIGVIMFSRGVSGTVISKTIGIESTEIAELSRIALRDHSTSVSRLLSIAIKMLKKISPGLRCLISYADENQGHLGIIYQASNWIYSGQSNATSLYYTSSGKLVHGRTVCKTGINRQFGQMRKGHRRSDVIEVKQFPKWRYFMPLDSEIRTRILLLAKPYPKRAGSKVALRPSSTRERAVQI